MPSKFADLFEPLVSAAIDDIYGEPTRIFRMVKNQIFAASASGDAPIDVIGVIDVNPVTVTAQDEGSYDGMQPQLAGEKYHVSYDLSLFTVPGTQPVQGSEIEATTRSEIPRLRVTRVDPDGIGRIVCVCSKAE